MATEQTQALRDRFAALTQLLIDSRPLWEPNPFYERSLCWEHTQPELTQFLLGLTDAELAQLNSGKSIANEPIFVTDLRDRLAAVTHVEPYPTKPLAASHVHGVHWHVPGRKWEQITAFAETLTGALERPPRKIVDWCSGKGHLGRTLAEATGAAVECLELNPTLCEDGRQLSQRMSTAVTFRCIDVLHADAATSLVAECTVCALHACGELHTTLIQRATQQQVDAIAIAPCCYNRGYQGALSTIAKQCGFTPDDEAVKLCLRETVTSPARVQARRTQETHWRLAFDLLQRDATGNNSYRAIPSVPTSWLAGSFHEFAQRVAARATIELPIRWDADTYLQRGAARVAEVHRLGWLRNQFRRAIELWLVLDRALFIAEAGYAVSVGTFCDYHLTPRNLMILARKLH